MRIGEPSIAFSHFYSLSPPEFLALKTVSILKFVFFKFPSLEFCVWFPSKLMIYQASNFFWLSLLCCYFFFSHPFVFLLSTALFLVRPFPFFFHLCPDSLKICYRAKEEALESICKERVWPPTPLDSIVLHRFVTSSLCQTHKTQCTTCSTCTGKMLEFL